MILRIDMRKIICITTIDLCIDMDRILRLSRSMITSSQLTSLLAVLTSFFVCTGS